MDEASKGIAAISCPYLMAPPTANYGFSRHGNAGSNSRRQALLYYHLHI